jgi:hypothetical protein
MVSERGGCKGLANNQPPGLEQVPIAQKVEQYARFATPS